MGDHSTFHLRGNHAHEKALDQLERNFGCKICSGILIAAKGLDCGHAFCSYCLDVLQSVSQVCPHCNCRIKTGVPLPQIDKKIDALIKSLPTSVQHEFASLKAARAEQVADRAKTVAELKRTSSRSKVSNQQGNRSFSFNSSSNLDSVCSSIIESKFPELRPKGSANTPRQGLHSRSSPRVSTTTPRQGLNNYSSPRGHATTPRQGVNNQASPRGATATTTPKQGLNNHSSPRGSTATPRRELHSRSSPRVSTTTSRQTPQTTPRLNNHSSPREHATTGQSPRGSTATPRQELKTQASPQSSATTPRQGLNSHPSPRGSTASPKQELNNHSSPRPCPNPTPETGRKVRAVETKEELDLDKVDDLFHIYDDFLEKPAQPQPDQGQGDGDILLQMHEAVLMKLDEDEEFIRLNDKHNHDIDQMILEAQGIDELEKFVKNWGVEMSKTLAEDEEDTDPFASEGLESLLNMIQNLKSKANGLENRRREFPKPLQKPIRLNRSPLQENFGIVVEGDTEYDIALHKLKSHIDVRITDSQDFQDEKPDSSDNSEPSVQSFASESFGHRPDIDDETINQMAPESARNPEPVENVPQEYPQLREVRYPTRHVARPHTASSIYVNNTVSFCNRIDEYKSALNTLKSVNRAVRRDSSVTSLPYISPRPSQRGMGGAGDAFFGRDCQERPNSGPFQTTITRGIPNISPRPFTAYHPNTERWQ